MATSKYQLIKQHILQGIESGQWASGDPVPSENQLSQLFSVSRMTARRALQELGEQGVLVRTQGAATCVASLKSQSSILEIRNIADEIRQRHCQYRALVIEQKSTQSDLGVATLLGLAPGATIYSSLICHWQDNLPLQLELRYVNPQLVPDYLEQDFTQITPHEYLSLVAPLTEAEHRVEAILADGLAREHLKVAAGSPCLRLHRTTWSRDGIVSHALLTHPGDKYQLGGHLTFPSRQETTA
ncbi:histidine utilization repressor [Aliiglaciecola sp. CAU 1673]|uniref:histidine utilization repressor n=1 Tax=Aliiglaciecola sp. CAU 1673 TaxID=3032595 RepID=UPI0023DB75C7|nr:histidine utilization repressor [Aliiglaciecola sp. CAU 1673]MDF2179184.1 histidine utilization repressor [Aliiglaciecola sp. CAU 1673]